VIPYELAGQYAKFVHAIFIIESQENPAAVGDGGRALGLGQMHPAFFCQYYFPKVGDTWEMAWVRTAGAFFDRWYAHLGLDKAVMGYNLGISAVQNGQTNQDYLDRFKEALAKLP
jgi:hypothetical protein